MQRIASHLFAFTLSFGVIYLGTQLAPVAQSVAKPRPATDSVLDRAQSVDIWWLPGER